MPIIATPIGNIQLTIREECLSELKFTQLRPEGELLDPLLLEAKKQLEEYFLGQRKVFNLPIGLWGTDFQRKVWLAVGKIPFGQTITYAKLAEQLGNPAAIRAVGTAIGANPLLIILPCHRIIGSNGSLTGYAGGLEKKKALLQLEGQAVQGTLF
ncbi:MAG: methylated-DNA--[protein]-cysteine S-methyltransferase [Bacteroidetes bacterium]|nr:methylated-DNA--[protein]-cysteine S-methyltransferase [Bacteroidota bacterium]